MQSAVSDLHATDARHDGCRIKFMRSQSDRSNSHRYVKQHAAFDAVINQVMSDKEWGWTSVNIISIYADPSRTILSRIYNRTHDWKQNNELSAYTASNSFWCSY